LYRPFLHLVLVLSVVWPTTVSAESTQEVQDQRPFAQVLHHFDLRIRNDIFHNGGLGNTLAIVPGDRGLATPQIGDDPQIAGGNVRLRYLPTFRIGENLKLEGRFELLRSSLYHSLDSQAAEQMFDDQIRVRALAAHWEPLPRLWVSLGRIPQHFGLGLVEHDECIDCDFDSVLDGASVQINLGALSASVAWYWPGEGPTSAWVPKGSLFQNTSGQAYDVAQDDDVGLFHFGLSSQRFTELEEAERVRLAQEQHSWLYDWQVRLRKRSSDLASDRFAVSGADECPGAPDVPCPGTLYDDFPLTPRWLSLWSPGLYFHFRAWPREGHFVDLGVELEGHLGSVERSQSDPDVDTDRSIRSVAGAVRARYQRGAIFLRLDSGFATGDPERSTLGVRSNTSSSQAAYPEGDFYAEEDDSYRVNETWEQFVFHRNFHVDRILFREIVGAVSNAAYVRPALGYDLGLGGMALQSELSATASWAIAPEATPGKERYYGLETGLDMRLKIWDSTQLHLGGALFLPGAALGDPEALGTVWTGQLDLFVQY
jgi:uncharacterized protein (TIGR04551 family)